MRALAGGLGCFPFDHGAYPPQSHSRGSRRGIRSLVGEGSLVGPLPHSVLYPRDVVARGCTEIHFGENQILAGLISLLLLSTAHPLSLQPKWVRASTAFYSRFTLAMDSSPAFGSAPYDRIALFTLAFATAPPLKGLTKPQGATRRLIIQKARRHTASASARRRTPLRVPSRGGSPPRRDGDAWCSDRL